MADLLGYSRMNRQRLLFRLTLIGCISLLSLSACSAANEPTPTHAATNTDPVQVEIITTLGDMTLELYPSAAPNTVANFLRYVDEGFYEDLIFHRVIAGFMIQGGGFNQDLQRQRTRPAIRNESNNGLSNQRGSIAMARTQDPHSATAQFYINLAANPGLDARGRQPGYAVFGRVTNGLAVLDAIGAVATTTQATSLGSMADVPITPIIMQIRRKPAP